MKDGFSRLVEGMTAYELNQCAAALLSALGGGKKAAEFFESPVQDGEEKTRPPMELDIKAQAKSQNAPEAFEEGALPLEARPAPQTQDKKDTGAENDTPSPKKRLEAQEQEPFRRLRREPGQSVGSGGDKYDFLSGAAEQYAAGEPHRRYENSVGRRGLEMNRVSEYFSRDARRYDSGFEKY